MKKGIEFWPDYDRDGTFVLHITKARGSLTLEDIRETAAKYDEGTYLLPIHAIFDEGPMFELAEQPGDHVVLYRAEDCFRGKETQE